jgi:hypothetical protein
MLDLGTLAAVAAGASLATTGLGFLPGESVKAEIFSPNGAFVGTARIQTSVDGTVWTDVGPATHTTPGFNTYMITLANFIRLNCTAFTSGNVKAVVVNEIG